MKFYIYLKKQVFNSDTCHSNMAMVTLKNHCNKLYVRLDNTLCDRVSGEDSKNAPY